MNIPENLKYTTEHEWVKFNGNEAIIGITQFAQCELGDIVFVEFPQISDSFEKGNSFGTIEAVKTVADLFSPITGEIVEINNLLKSQPELINTDPYGEGWIVKISVSNPSDMDDLLDCKSYEKILS